MEKPLVFADTPSSVSAQVAQEEKDYTEQSQYKEAIQSVSMNYHWQSPCTFAALTHSLSYLAELRNIKLAPDTVSKCVSFRPIGLFH
jgi:hypothetical protein